MSNITLSLDDHLLTESREYARRQGTTLDALVGDLLWQNVERKPGAAMVEEAKARGLRSEDGPMSREEAHEG